MALAPYDHIWSTHNHIPRLSRTCHLTQLSPFTSHLGSGHTAGHPLRSLPPCSLPTGKALPCSIPSLTTLPNLARVTTRVACPLSPRPTLSTQIPPNYSLHCHSAVHTALSVVHFPARETFALLPIQPFITYIHSPTGRHYCPLNSGCHVLSKHGGESGTSPSALPVYRPHYVPISHSYNPIHNIAIPQPRLGLTARGRFTPCHCRGPLALASLQTIQPITYPE